VGVLVAGEGPEEDLEKSGGGGRPVVATRESFARGGRGAGHAGGGRSRWGGGAPRAGGAVGGKRRSGAAMPRRWQGAVGQGLAACGCVLCARG